MIETIEQMTCEELTAAYVILKDLQNIGDTFTYAKDINQYVKILKDYVVSVHEKKLEDMRKEFYAGGKNYVQH